jgi:hypothetical protein
MPIFTIDSDNNVSAYADGATIQPEAYRVAVTTEKQLASATKEWPVTDLVALWNSFAGVVPFGDSKPVKKFTDRQAATKRIWSAIQRLAADFPPAAAPQPGRGTPQGRRSRKESSPAVEAPQTPAAREGSKKATVLDLLRSDGGATLQAIMTATGWQAHTVRGFMSTLPAKAGVTIESFKNEANERSYRLAK